MTKDHSGVGFWPEGFWSPGHNFTPEKVAQRAKRNKQESKISTLKCDQCGSKDLNILADMCRRCGASVSDPTNEFRSS